jgi:hypothetical protein
VGLSGWPIPNLNQHTAAIFALLLIGRIPNLNKHYCTFRLDLIGWIPNLNALRTSDSGDPASLFASTSCCITVLPAGHRWLQPKSEKLRPKSIPVGSRPISSSHWGLSFAVGARQYHGSIIRLPCRLPYGRHFLQRLRILDVNKKISLIDSLSIEFDYFYPYYLDNLLFGRQSNPHTRILLSLVCK